MSPVDNPATRSPERSDEDALVAALRAGDEAAFTELVRRYAPAMLRTARLYVRDRAVAEEIVQDTWIRVLRAIDSFEGRSSLRTWIFVILGNCARRRAERESRSVPIASFAEADDAPTVEPDRFFPAEHPRWAGMWSTLVPSWDELPDDALASAEAKRRLTEAVAALPANYAAVFTLRDIEGWESSEVCALLGLTPENQRVLLHRARARIRAALEEYFQGELA
jgi:RNA polymerase sigma-70 factor (ECF subfamily)